MKLSGLVSIFYCFYYFSSSCVLNSYSWWFFYCVLFFFLMFIDHLTSQMITSYSRVLIFVLPVSRETSSKITAIQFQIWENKKLSCNHCWVLRSVLPYPYDVTLDTYPFPLSSKKLSEELFNPLSPHSGTGKRPWGKTFWHESSFW